MVLTATQMVIKRHSKNEMEKQQTNFEFYVVRYKTWQTFLLKPNLTDILVF